LSCSTSSADIDFARSVASAPMSSAAFAATSLHRMWFGSRLCAVGAGVGVDVGEDDQPPDSSGLVDGSVVVGGAVVAGTSGAGVPHGSSLVVFGASVVSTLGL